MKKLLIAIFATLLIFAAPINTFAVGTIPNDITGTKYEVAVSTLISAGIVKGYPDGTFKPTQTLNRAEACKMIVMVLNPTFDLSYAPVFNDLTGYAWASSDIAYAAKSGIINGYGDNTFRPGNIVTLNEMITMTIRAMGYQDKSLNANWPNGFINKANELGILNGIDLGIKNINRGDSAMLLYNSFTQIGIIGGTHNQLGVVISKNIITNGDSNNITIINSDGVTSTYDIPKANQKFASLFSGDVVGFRVDLKENITSLVKKDVIYAYNKSFTQLSSYNGMSVSADTKTFTFGLKADFSTDKATFSSINSDYGITSIRLLQNISTSSYYVIENGKIMAMIVPRDVGFSGRAYGVILDTFKEADIDGKEVAGIKLLLGTNIVHILTNGTAVVPTDASLYLNGQAYEISIRNGIATNVANSEPSSIPAKKNNAFVELTNGYAKVTDKGITYVVVDNGAEGVQAMELSNDAAIYVVTYDGDIPDSYKAGDRSSIRDGLYIRAYDVTDDGDSTANIIVISKVAFR
ncbi:MAG: S-layer homology domain-containing protein [Eubacteriales bacterium]